MYQFKLEKEENIHLTRSVVNQGHVPHTHDFIEIVYICEGIGIHTINSNSYPVRRGDLLFINFNEVHSYSTDESMEFINVLISPKFLSEKLINSYNALDILKLSVFREFCDSAEEIYPQISFHGVEMLEVESILNYMIAEYRQKAPGYMVVLKSYVNVLLTKIFRNFNKQKDENFTYNLKKITPEVLKYIKDNYNKKITLKELAKHNFYNASYFSTVFKECFGKTPLEYINEIRIEKAVELIKKSDMTIEEICHEVGYHNKNHFYKIFKSATGMTPNDFRKNAHA